MSFLKLVLKNVSKKKQILENQRKKYKVMDASKKKQMLNRKAVKSRKSYDSMDCEKKEKYLNAIRNQSAIPRQNRKISKLHVDVCPSQFCQKIKEGPYYVCTVCNRMLYRKSVLIFNKQKYVNCNIQNIFTEKLSFDNKEYICKTCHSKVIKGKAPCQAVMEERLCFRCFSPHHVASTCKENANCSICGSRRHPDLLHLRTEEKKDRAKEAQTANEAQENINAKCTSICKGAPGRLSCSKKALVDTYREDRPNEVHRIYAIVDDQSNASIISTELADKLNAEGPEWKYYLSTCGGAKEVRYGRRLTGLIISSIHGRTSRLPTLIECDGIPQDKKEIPTPEMAREHPHLRSIAVEIPSLDKEAKIQLLIGRDAPELLKVRAFKNGPKGAPWAQKLASGWTISGQTCLDLKDGPIHVQTKRTSVVTDS